MTRSRDTSNTFIEQDQLARAYAGTNAPVRDKERLADVWFVEEARTANEETKKLTRVGTRSLTKRTRYYKKRRI